MQFLQKIFQTAAILRCSIILSAGTFAIMLLFEWLNRKKKSCVVIWQKTCWLSFWKRELLQAPTSASDYKICPKFGAQFLFHVKSKKSVCNTSQFDKKINVNKWNGKFCKNVWLTAKSIVKIKSYPFLHSWLHDLRSVLDSRKRSSSNHLEFKKYIDQA